MGDRAPDELLDLDVVVDHVLPPTSPAACTCVLHGEEAFQNERFTRKLRCQAEDLLVFAWTQ